MNSATADKIDFIPESAPARQCETLKAFQCFYKNLADEALLVFAPSREKARYLALKAGLSEYDSYTSIGCWRAHLWDEYCDRIRVIECNDDLPPGAPNFYWEDEPASKVWPW